MKHFITPLLLLVVGFASFGAETKHPEPVPLWPDGAPGATGSSDEDKPAVYVYPAPGDKNTGCAVLVCPGGGFETRCIDQEGVMVANWLNERGINAFILRYRIRPLYTTKESLRDAQRAMQFIRSKSGEYKISADRVGIIGFSAGAELAAMASLNTLAAQAEAQDPLDRFGTRPDFQILVYGTALPSGDASLSGVPPTFLFCTAEDAGHLRPMADYYAKLRQARVPAEVHFFPHGEHGVGMALGDPVLGQWPGLLHNWMRAGNFLTGETRYAAKGLITIDGEALPHGYVTFHPIDNEKAPAVTAYVLNTGPVRGAYTVRAEQGLVPGTYRVEVRQDAGRWLSNSRNPLRLEMQQKQRAGALTEEDRKQWHDYVRARDLSPSIEGLKVFRKLRGTDAEDMTVEIKAGENAHDFTILTR